MWNYDVCQKYHYKLERSAFVLAIYEKLYEKLEPNLTYALSSTLMLVSKNLNVLNMIDILGNNTNFSICLSTISHTTRAKLR